MKDDEIQMVPYWGFHAEPNPHPIPTGRIGASFVSCGNPECETGCPSVCILMIVEGSAIEVRLDATPALNLAGLIAEAAKIADPKGAN